MDTFLSQMFGSVRILKDSYNNGSLAILLVAADDAENEITVLSVNLSDHAHRLRQDEFFPKTWSENAEIAREALASGAVIDTGVSVSTSLGPMPIWRCP